jgi:hypothetical protein
MHRDHRCATLSSPRPTFRAVMSHQNGPITTIGVVCFKDPDGAILESIGGT